MASRVAYAGSIASSSAVTSTNYNKNPGGKIGRTSATSDSAGTTSTETVATIAVTVAASREIDVHVVGNLRATVAGNVSVRVHCDGTQIGRKNQYIAGSAQDYTYDIWFTHQPSAGTRTYELITGVSGATGATVTNIASAENSTQGATRIEVFDSGVSF